MSIRDLVAVAITCAAIATSAAAQQDQKVRPTPTRAAAQQAAPPAVEAAKGPHGGPLQQIDSLQMELMIEPAGLRLFFYDRQGRPIDVRQGRGLATLQVAGDAKRYRYDLFAEVDRDKTARSLAAAVDLTRVAGKQVDVSFHLVGLPGSGRGPLKFSSAARVPMTEAQQVAAAIAAQGICPVSGKRLGSMGQPIAVSVGDRSVYICCPGCAKKLHADPAIYLKKLADQGVVSPSVK